MAFTSKAMVATTNAKLQAQLSEWVASLEAVQNIEKASKIRGDAITAFCRTFVPAGVTEDDIEGFSGQLSEDGEFFDSFCRELKHCTNGDCVEKITGDQTSKAIFTIVPDPDSNITIDIVREIAFICQDGTWRAEG